MDMRRDFRHQPIRYNQYEIEKSMHDDSHKHIKITLTHKLWTTPLRADCTRFGEPFATSKFHVKNVMSAFLHNVCLNDWK